MEAGGATAGSGRALRLDPFALPVQFRTGDAAADGQIRHIELDRERVVLRRALRGMPIRLRLPVSSFRGVALNVQCGPQGAALGVVLHHRDEALCVPLLVAGDDGDAIVVWKAWGRVLGLPLLVAQEDGTYREIGDRLGAIAVGEVSPRRRRRSALKRRRPSILLRRRAGRSLEGAQVHHGEREIIARN
jgi:hypothetical protein